MPLTVWSEDGARPSVDQPVLVQTVLSRETPPTGETKIVVTNTPLAAPSAEKSVSSYVGVEALRDAISASNQTVDRVSRVFDSYGKWIGTLATLITAAGGLLAWFTFKSLGEIRAEHRTQLAEHSEQWTKRCDKFLADAKSEMEKLSGEARRHAEAAEASAKAAAAMANDLEAAKALLDKTMKDVDQLRGRLRVNVDESGGAAAASVQPAPVDELAADVAKVAAAVQSAEPGGSTPSTS